LFGFVVTLLPAYATKFIEIILMVIADHGPAVSGAHNTIVAARAGKDLVSSLTSGLLTIGPRFGGDMDEATSIFTDASDAFVDAQQFVKDMRKQNKLIIWELVMVSNPFRIPTSMWKSSSNMLFNTFPMTVLKFALAGKQMTTQKKANLILNVDGCIAVCFVDMMQSCGAFSNVEADELVKHGCLNVLGVR
jgi:ATP citrate (pro-S)-lyase